ncbi:MAG: hypothetical protein GC165_10475 [Armatimonadetes bacterium]|nr:hypothetical protein [Armatimonadota bacterium]
MNPEQPPSSGYSQYPRDPGMGPYAPFQGDKIYVFADVALFVLGLIMTFVFMPALTQASLENARAQGGPQADPAQIQTFMMIAMGCGFVVCIPITILIWANIWKGKKWAFIVALILAALGILGNIRNMVGPAMMLGLFGMATSVARLVYCTLRAANKLGPPTT